MDGKVLNHCIPLLLFILSNQEVKIANLRFVFIYFINLIQNQNDSQSSVNPHSVSL